MRKNNKKRNRLIAILTTVILSVGMVITPLTVSAYGPNAVEWEHFGMQLITTTTGYNTSPAYKSPNFPIFLVYYQYCSYGSNYPVNFLIIAPDGGQLSHNVIVNGSNQTGYNFYYAENHEGNVMMRANTGSYQSGYYIYGEWAANAFFCD